MTATTTPAGPSGHGGTLRESRTYFDAQGRRHLSRIAVPVNDNGEIAKSGWECRRCTQVRWYPLSMKKPPVCPVHERLMQPMALRRPPLLPWRELWDVCEKPLRPVWTLPGMAAAGWAVDAGNVPALAVAGAAPLAFEVTRRAWRGGSIRRALRRGALETGDDVYGKRLRAAIDAAARKAGYVSAGATGWLAAVAVLGLDPATLGGKVAWTLALAPWLPVAATYWHRLREAAKPMARVEAQPVPKVQQADEDEQRIQRIWRTILAVNAGDVIGTASDGVTPIKAQTSGRLAGTKLTGWRRIRGGWAAVIVGPPGVYDSDAYLNARAKIASAFSVTKAMVSLVPDGEDENRCALYVQKASVISEKVAWSGPGSVNAETGQAPMVRYVDGSIGMYEIYRPGWGCPHELYIGTTGAAKSSALELVFAIDRWAQHQGRGIVADFLIDPQQGQSFGAFADDLAAPVASTADEAMMIGRAFRREMLRRNKYLARKHWTDGKGRDRRGVKWWNPLVEGCLLCLNIDEAHEFLAIREFAAMITAGGRMFRKCGMKMRLATHTPLLTDLGGSMALRDMVTGGFVWCGRTANSLSGPTAFNGRLPADPKTIPEVPGAAYILSALEKKPMLARTMWVEDFYDFVRDGGNRPIGFPGVLAPETLDAFGEEYADWLKFMASDMAEQALWTPDSADPVRVEQGSDPVNQEYLREMVLWALTNADGPMDMNGLDAVLHGAEVEASALAMRDALTVLRGQGKVVTRDGRHGLSPQARAELDAKLREAEQQVQRMLDEEQP